MKVKTPITSRPLVNIFLILAIICIGVFILIYAKSVLKPMVAAALLSMLLLPIKKLYQRWFRYKSLASLLSIITVTVPFVVIGLIVTRQVNHVLNEIPPFNTIINNSIGQINIWIRQLGFTTSWETINLEQSLEDNTSSIVNFLGSSLSLTSSIIFMLLLTLICTFFFLWYSNAVKEFIVIQFKKSSRVKLFETISRLKSMLVQYVSGLLYVSLIMAVINSLGLWIIGIDYPILWGCLAAILIIIPYLGTFLGGLFPILYILGTTDKPIMALWVAIFYIAVQQVEGNFITPKIVGDSIRINPLVVILSMLVGGLIWGITGIIIAVPMVGMLRIILNSFDPLKPVAELLGNKLHLNKFSILEQYDEDKYRITSLSKQKTKE